MEPQKFITVLTSARHLSLSWANSIQSPQPLPISWRSILILSSHIRLGLPNGLFPSGFPTKTLCTPLPSSIHATCPAHLILLDFISKTRIKKNPPPQELITVRIRGRSIYADECTWYLVIIL